MKIAVIGDIHANSIAFRKALQIVDTQGCDLLVLSGDLLTYGVDVEDTLDLVEKCNAVRRTVVVRGNHDAMYDALLEGDTKYYKRLPPWLRECVDWTMNRLSLSDWQAIPFVDDFHLGKILISHANPFGFGNWSYLRTSEENMAAVDSLRQRDHRVGIFSHTHRARWYRQQGASGFFITEHQGDIFADEWHILNTGSIGQPRELDSPSSTMLWLIIDDSSMDAQSFKVEIVDWAVQDHCDKLLKSGLSLKTCRCLMSYFTDPKH